MARQVQDTDLAEAVATRAIARGFETRLLADRAAGAVPAAAAVSAADLWRHATRRPGEPIDFAVAKALRDDADAAARYRKMLSGVAVASSPLALAASTTGGGGRTVGDFRLELVEDTPNLPPLLILSAVAAGLDEADGMPGEIEVFGMDGPVRVELPPSVRGHIQMVLDPGDPDHQRLRSLLTEPTAEVFLIPTH